MASIGILSLPKFLHDIRLQPFASVRLNEFGQTIDRRCEKMASNSGRRFAVSRSLSHAITLGDKRSSNHASDEQEIFPESNAPGTVRVRESRRSRF
jgi:hypothetical protein